ncbi:hypothetical protein [Moraxella marmotae]
MPNHHRRPLNPAFMKLFLIPSHTGCLEGECQTHPKPAAAST